MPRYRQPRQRMKTQERTFWEILSVVVAIACLMGVMQHIYSVQKVEVLLRYESPGIPRAFDPGKLAARNQHARELYNIWQARNQRDVTKDVKKFLKDDYREVQGSAVRVLARLGTSAAETAISEYIETTQKELYPSGYVPFSLRMALGRAQARDFKGRAKVAAVARSAGLSFDEIVMLSARIHTTIKSEVWGTDGYAIMQQMIDLLTDMGKQGENIKPIVNQLTLNPAQQVQLKATSLPIAERTQMIVDYIAGLDVVTGDTNLLKQCLLNETDSVTTDILVQKLQDIYAGRGKVGRSGYIEIFRTAEKTGDARVYQLLEAFENNPDSRIRGYALQSRMTMESQAFYPPLP